MNAEVDGVSAEDSVARRISRAEADECMLAGRWAEKVKKSAASHPAARIKSRHDQSGRLPSQSFAETSHPQTPSGSQAHPIPTV